MSTPSLDRPAVDEALLWFVEKFALILHESGMDRMAARVFAYVLAEDSDRYTAAELSEGLGVSRAAISGATRSLLGAGLLAREREPGARADHYRVYDEDVWAAIYEQRSLLLSRYEEVVAEGVEMLGVDTRGGRRLLQTLAYFEFAGQRMQAMVDEWHQHKDDVVAELAKRYRQD